VNLPDMIESSNLKRGRWATEGAELTGARRRFQAALVVGEVIHASGSYFEVIECSGHALGSCSEVIGCSSHTSGSCSEVIRCSGTGDGETKGMGKMHGGGPFYSHALRGGDTGMCKEREREMTARLSGRASVLTRAARRSSDVAVAAFLRGGDAEGVCPYAVGEEVSWTRG
jgi:hypothetical protein